MHCTASTIPAPACKLCGAAMALVGKLPSIQDRPEIQVFRCYNCKLITAEESQRV